MVTEPDATDGGRRQVRVVCVFVRFWTFCVPSSFVASRCCTAVFLRVCVPSRDTRQVRTVSTSSSQRSKQQRQRQRQQQQLIVVEMGMHSNQQWTRSKHKRPASDLFTY